MDNLLILLAILIFQILLPITVLLFLLSGFVSMISGAPYVPISKKSIKKVLSFGGLSSRDTLYDLGCGDGRILISGSLNFGVPKAVGYEIALWPYLKALLLIKYSKLFNIKVFRRNCFKADVSQATFIYLYLFPKLVDKIAYKIAGEGKPETKVLCVTFPIDTNRHVEFQLLKSVKLNNLTAYLYELKSLR
ncbi:MAG: hypothetical protein A2734_02825 [Parcubacteria group bacterium RIFCSPHIGHO2_01_FULL_40_30]|nr:MAG: hypothetical protein A2734_02825 [Parcubacteria group bacterium RIFCSPHIGHO2_01_FULL_40_30]OHB23583.1 MAG: hypothetical protein A3I22_02965 [Parcubacteria group bacterium RIFCSPLOWO2_02_FULL_40_12]